MGERLMATISEYETASGAKRYQVRYVEPQEIEKRGFKSRADAERFAGTVEVTKYATLNEAMAGGDALAEAEIRYRLLAEAFEGQPQLRSQLNSQLERPKAEIVQLRALAPKPSDSGKSESETTSGKVVAFDADRFRKSG